MNQNQMNCSQILKSNPRKPVSQLPPGATGYLVKSRQQTTNELADRGVSVVSGRDWLSRVPETVAFPDHHNPLEFLKVKDQRQTGSCAGFASAQVGEGCFHLESGEVERFNGWAQYYLAQEKGGLLGRDVGSMPQDNAWACINVGLVPSSVCPDPPATYQQGWRVTTEMREAAAPFRMKSIVDLDADDIKPFLTKGQGYITAASIWPANFDQGGNVITSFYGPRRQDQHGGGHMYSIMGWYNHPQHGWCALLVNSWGVQHWGDEGAKLITLRALQEMAQHQFTVFLGWSDMEQDHNKLRTAKFDIRDLA